MVMSVIEPAPWWPWIGMLLILEMSMLEPVAPAASTPVVAVQAVAAVEPADRRVKPGGRQELDRAEDPAVDQAGLDVAPAAA